MLLLQGISGLSWCPQDPSLLMSSGKDGRTVVWDVNAADIVCETTSHGGGFNFDVQWCPTTAGVFSTASFEGKVAVNNIHDCTIPRMVETVNADFTVSQVPAGEIRKVQTNRNPSPGGWGGRLVGNQYS